MNTFWCVLAILLSPSSFAAMVKVTSKNATIWKHPRIGSEVVARANLDESFQVMTLPPGVSKGAWYKVIVPHVGTGYLHQQNTIEKKTITLPQHGVREKYDSQEASASRKG